jgi:hypothetical protein
MSLDLFGLDGTKVEMVIRRRLGRRRRHERLHVVSPVHGIAQGSHSLRNDKISGINLATSTLPSSFFPPLDVAPCDFDKLETSTLIRRFIRADISCIWQQPRDPDEFPWGTIDSFTPRPIYRVGGERMAANPNAMVMYEVILGEKRSGQSSQSWKDVVFFTLPRVESISTKQSIRLDRSDLFRPNCRWQLSPTALHQNDCLMYGCG